MKKLILLATLLVATPLTYFKAADTVVESCEWAFFRLSDVFGPESKCEEWIERSQEMEEKFKSREMELQRDQQNLQKAAMEFQKKEQSKLLNDTTREAEVRKLTEMQNRMQQKGQQLQADAQRESKLLFEEIVQKIKVVMDRLKKQKGFKGFIVDAAWSVDVEIDYTDEIVRELNEEYRKFKKARDAKKAVASAKQVAKK